MTTLQITRSSDVLPEKEVAGLGPLLDDIERLKEERNAIVAAHNYMTPDIFHFAADIRGDSLARDSRATLTHRVEILPEVAERARVAVMRMLEVGRQD